MGRLALLILGSVLPACSFMLVKGAPSAPVDPDSRFECTTSSAAPAVDVALAAVSAGGGAALIATAPHSPCSDYSCVGGDAVKGLGIAGVVAGALYLASGVYGFVKTSGCREAVAAQRACLDGNTNMCDRLKRGTSNRAPP